MNRKTHVWGFAIQFRINLIMGLKVLNFGVASADSLVGVLCTGP